MGVTEGKGFKSNLIGPRMSYAHITDLKYQEEALKVPLKFIWVASVRDFGLRSLIPLLLGPW